MSLTKDIKEQLIKLADELQQSSPEELHLKQIIEAGLTQHEQTDALLKQCLAEAITHAQRLQQQAPQLLQQPGQASPMPAQFARGGRGRSAAPSFDGLTLGGLTESKPLQSAVSYLLYLNMLNHGFNPSGGISINLGSAFADARLYPQQEFNGSPFFELGQAGFNIRFNSEQARQWFRSFLETFDIVELTDMNLEAPGISGFEEHKIGLQISHAALPKFIDICCCHINNKHKIIMRLLSDIYAAKGLDRELLTLHSKHSRLEDICLAEYYRHHFNVLHAQITATANDSLSMQSENEDFSDQQPQRYMGSLLDLYNQYLQGQWQQAGLDPILHRLLHGLAIVLLPYTAAPAGISRRLGAHLHNLNPDAEQSPYCQLEPRGFCIYADAESAVVIQQQLAMHAIISAEESERGIASNSGADHSPCSDEYPAVIVIPHGVKLKKLLQLAQIPAPLLDPTLDQLYAAKGLNYWQELLSGHIGDGLSEHSATPIESAQVKVAAGNDGSLLLQSEITFANTQPDNPLHLMFILDNSGSMCGEKWKAAKKVVRGFIANTNTPANTKITLIHFSQGSPGYSILINKKSKEEMLLEVGFAIGQDQSTILPELNSVATDCGTPLIETCVAAAGLLNPGQTAADPKAIKDTRLVVITDGAGNSRESGEDILRAMATGKFKGKVIGIGLGTDEVPCAAPLMVAGFGIGRGYVPEVIKTLGQLCGAHHVSEASTDTVISGEVAEAASQAVIPAGEPTQLAVFNDQRECVLTARIPAPRLGQPNLSIHVPQANVGLDETLTFVIATGNEYQSVNTTALAPVTSEEKNAIFVTHYQKLTGAIIVEFYDAADIISKQSGASYSPGIFARGGGGVMEASAGGGQENNSLEALKTRTATRLQAIKDSAEQAINPADFDNSEFFTQLSGKIGDIDSYNFAEAASHARLDQRAQAVRVSGGR